MSLVVAGTLAALASAIPGDYMHGCDVLGAEVEAPPVEAKKPERLKNFIDDFAEWGSRPNLTRLDNLLTSIVAGLAVASMVGFLSKAITVNGPSIRAGVSPMQTGNWRTEPTISVPIRAVNDRSSR